MFTKFSRSWQLVKASAAVLRRDKALLLFPLMSTIAAAAVAATFVLPWLAFGADAAVEREPGTGGLQWLWLFAFYVALYTVIFFFNSALVAAALIRLAGGSPTLGDGLRIAFARLATIVGYAVIAATIGMLLRMLEERLSLVGRFVIGLIGIAWTVATFLTVPVLVSRDIGPLEAVRESARLLKRSWGENVVGNAGIGLVFAGIWFILVLLAFAVLMGPALSAGSGAVAIGLFGALAMVAVLLALVQSALQGVYCAALYRYAAEGTPGGGFDAETLASAFRRKS